MGKIRSSRPTSPYLLQHVDNPVDWWEWGSDAFAEARARDVPILLSVGYSACHWCHVMAHESFEDEETARFLNDRFVSIKVDREERPDIDRIYMDAVTATTGHGGWPMTVFLSHDAKPFYAGTYFPKHGRAGMPSFVDVLRAVDEAWTERRDGLIRQSEEITGVVAERAAPSSSIPSSGVADEAVDAIGGIFDAAHGGFGRAPKFPQPSTLEFLLTYATLAHDGGRSNRARGMVVTTLDHMRRGGIHDHLGGGFARYSVDDRWLVPHFEKMLYDNALLARLYLQAWHATGRSWMLETARSTLDYLATDLQDGSGGLHAAEDADADGREGSFAIWTWAELVDVLGHDVDLVATVYGATQDGNFEGANILSLPRPIDEVAEDLGMSGAELRGRIRDADDRLRDRRAGRVRPGRDDKIVTAWNGLALRAFADAGAALRDDRYLEVAEQIGGFLVETAGSGDRLLRSWRDGRQGPGGFCDDYAAAALGLFALYRATGTESWFSNAERLTRATLDLFSDSAGGYFTTPVDADPLIVRPRGVHDNPVPSETSLAAEAVATLAAYTGDGALQDRLAPAVQSVGSSLTTHPWAHGHLLAVWAANPPREIAIVGRDEPRRPMLDVYWEQFRPDTVLAHGEGRESRIPLLEGRYADGSGRAFVCRNLTCGLPAESPEELRDQLADS